jgi:hypothetical protein
MMFRYKYTDTFGGDADYAWRHRGVMPKCQTLASAVRFAKELCGLTGIR